MSFLINAREILLIISLLIFIVMSATPPERFCDIPPPVVPTVAQEAVQWEFWQIFYVN